MPLRAPALAVLVVAAALAGCVATPAPSPLEPPAATPAPWAALATTAETPSFAPVRSAAERRADVVPPGAPQFAAFDQVMLEFMASHQVPAASVAVLRNGQLRYEQGYGFLEEVPRTPTPPDAMFRIASITKPMTAAVIAMLVEQGLLAYDDPVFCLPPQPAPDCALPLAPHPKRPVVDERLAQVTVRHLVDHQTGWTRWPCTEPFWNGNPIDIAKEFGIPAPAPDWAQAQWMMGYPMEFDPGTEPEGLDTYCNLGYTMLGLIAEAKTGTELEALYEAYLFRPLEVAGDLEPGQTLPALRNPREPFYFCDEGETRSVFDPDQQVCWPDGGFDLRGFLPGGGLIGTAAAVGAVYEVFWNDGSLREAPGTVFINGHTGGLPGTATTAQRSSLGPLGDVQVVVLFNKASGHDDLPGFAAVPYHYQLLHAALLGAYVDAEAQAPLPSTLPV